MEHIIVDGSSTDGTLDIVRAYALRYDSCHKSLRWLSEPDDGLYDAMNKGIRLATGDVVGILNSDDFFSSDNVLELIAQNIENVDAVYADIHYIDKGTPGKPVRYYSSAGFKPWKMLAGYMPAHPSFYCRRRVYQTFGVYDTGLKIGADFDQLFNLIYINRITSRYINNDFVTMRTGGASTSGLRSHLNILRDHFTTYSKHNLSWAIGLDLFRYPLKLISLLTYRLKHR